jgi:hypothetical protein
VFLAYLPPSGISTSTLTIIILRISHCLAKYGHAPILTPLAPILTPSAPIFDAFGTYFDTIDTYFDTFDTYFDTS